MTVVAESNERAEVALKPVQLPPGERANKLVAAKLLQRPYSGLFVLLLAMVISAIYGGFQSGFPTSWVPNVTTWFNSVANWITVHQNTAPFFVHFLTPIGNWLGNSVNAVTDVLNWLSWPGVIALFAGTAVLAGKWRVAIFVVIAMFYFGLIGLWSASMSTLALMSVAVLISVVLGVPLGIAAAASRVVEEAIRPILDLMQMLPAYAYLVPIVLLFGIGNSGGIIATVIYAIAPVIRLTMLGIHSVPYETVEAGKSFGSNKWQLLRKVQLPMALKPIVLGINQVIMMALSVVVIASLVGTGGLGDPILQALNIVDVGDALTAGVAIVFMAMILDRIVSAVAENVGRNVSTKGQKQLISPRNLRIAVGALVIVAIALGNVVGGGGSFPAGLSLSLSAPVNSFLSFLQSHLYHFSSIPVIGGTSNLSSFTTLEILNPLTRIIGDFPWWLAIFGTGVIGYLIAGWRRAVLVSIGVTAIGLLGMWTDASVTLSQVLVALVLCVAIGIPLGIAAYWWPPLEKVLRPILDVLQTMPAFVYLIPVVLFFSVGNMAGVTASFVYALAPAVRLTNLGLRQIKVDMIEAGNSFGATRFQMLRKVELPAARPTIVLAINQTIMLVLAEVIVAGLVGAGGLGYDVVVGLGRDEFGLGLSAGLAIVVLGIVFDRLTQGRPAGRRS